MTQTVGVVGAGAMGAGIAQVAAMHGWRVHLKDVDEATVQTAIDGIAARLDRQVEKGRVTATQRDGAVAKLNVAGEPGDLAKCDLIIEAIVENLDIKTRVLSDLLPALRADCIVATNTSSLSVTRIGAAIGEPRRTLGMHFFNPAPIMKLVEVIAGDDTDSVHVDRVAAIATSWGKQVAGAADVPGFIVNHVARPYYLEAFRILEDGYAGVAEIDDIMKRLGGFRMGPFELTDLIGQDVNSATTRSVWEQLGAPPLLTPSRQQEQLVIDGHLGRKTGRGAYDYSGDVPEAALATDRQPLAISEAHHEAAVSFMANATDVADDALNQYVFARILVAIIAQAVLAHERGVASRADIDTALKYGVNYPKGPIEWAEQIGWDRCTELLAALNATTDDGRFAVPDALRQFV